jgi:hypothetical protein
VISGVSSFTEQCSTDVYEKLVGAISERHGFPERWSIETITLRNATDAGVAYLAASKRILDKINAAETLASGEYTAPPGELILTAPITLGRFHVLGTVNDLLKAYPEINVPMSLSDPAGQSVGPSREGGNRRAKRIACERYWSPHRQQMLLVQVLFDRRIGWRRRCLSPARIFVVARRDLVRCDIENGEAMVIEALQAGFVSR